MLGSEGVEAGRFPIQTGMLYNACVQEADGVTGRLRVWADENDLVRAMILTGSRADPRSTTDILSDYDVKLYVSSVQPFMTDDWLGFFGDVMARWPLQPGPTFDRDWITRLVLFENRVRIDFQITAKEAVDPIECDSGFRVLVDKCGLTAALSEATPARHIITRPTRNDYEALVNDFFWDATYVAKHLWRDEIYFAKYMLDCMIRFEHLRTIIEWYIGTRNNWSVSSGKHGRFFRRYIDEQTWAEVEATFVDADLENNWRALFDTIGLFRKLAKRVAKDLGYDYPDTLDHKVTDYCRQIKQVSRKSQ